MILSFNGKVVFISKLAMVYRYLCLLLPPFVNISHCRDSNMDYMQSKMSGPKL